MRNSDFSLAADFGAYNRNHISRTLKSSSPVIMQVIGYPLRGTAAVGRLERRSCVNVFRNPRWFCAFAIPQGSAFCHRAWVRGHAWYDQPLAAPDKVVAGIEFFAARVLLFGESEVGVDQRSDGFTGWNRIPGNLCHVGIPRV